MTHLEERNNLIDKLHNACDKENIKKVSLVSYVYDEKTKEYSHITLGVEYTEPYRVNLIIPLVVAISNVIEDDKLVIKEYNGEGDLFYYK